MLNFLAKLVKATIWFNFFLKSLNAFLETDLELKKYLAKKYQRQQKFTEKN